MCAIYICANVSFFVFLRLYLLFSIFCLLSSYRCKTERSIKIKKCVVIVRCVVLTFSASTLLVRRHSYLHVCLSICPVFELCTFCVVAK